MKRKLIVNAQYGSIKDLQKPNYFLTIDIKGVDEISVIKGKNVKYLEFEKNELVFYSDQPFTVVVHRPTSLKRDDEMDISFKDGVFAKTFLEYYYGE